jgi:hypothetical protein
MQAPYEARRISKRRADEIKKSSVALGRALLLATFNGFIIIEPRGANLGDGAALSEQEADYELQPVWHLGPQAMLRQARERLGLESDATRAALSHS